MTIGTSTQTTNTPKAVIIFVVVFVALTALFVGFYIRRREIVFEGIVIDKDVIENVQNNNMNMNRPGITFGNSGGVTHTYRIKVKTDAGKEINYQITEGKYEIIKIGDRVSKPKGTTEVNITPAVPGAAPSPQPPASVPPATPTAGTFV